MKAFNDKEFRRILWDNGYSVIRSHGDHTIYSNGKNKIVVNKSINKMVAQRLIKTNHLKIK